MTFRSLALPLAGLLLFLACDSGTSPVAPSGTTLTIDANPKVIGPFGTSTITVTAFDTERGTPIREGTEINFTTTVGQIDPVARTDRDGVAQATLRGDGRTQKATVTARSGLADKAGGTGKSITIEVEFKAFDLTANFKCTPAGLRIKCDDMTDGDPTTWAWDFGDEKGRSSDRNPEYLYDDPGTYLVTLTVSSPEGGENTKSDFVTVVRVQARFTATANGLTVTFTNSSSPDPKTSEWDFGDGNFSTQKNPSHTYATADTYDVTLSITTEGAGADSTTQSIHVSPKPVASFEFFAEDLKVTFTDTSTGDPTSWDWNFGDGNRSTQQNPVHTYEDSGTYTVKLKVANAGGESEKTESVAVSGRLQASFTFQVNGLNVNFTDTSKNDPANWEWDFGDPPGFGGADSSTLQNPAYTYGVAGTYTVTLKVKKPGEESLVSKSVKVQ